MVFLTHVHLNLNIVKHNFNLHCIMLLSIKTVCWHMQNNFNEIKIEYITVAGFIQLIF